VRIHYPNPSLKLTAACTVRNVSNTSTHAGVAINAIYTSEIQWDSNNGRIGHSAQWSTKPILESATIEPEAILSHESRKVKSKLMDLRGTVLIVQNNGLRSVVYSDIIEIVKFNEQRE
jgi:hypothetical protein